MLIKVLNALRYLHDRGIYHRDIKPGNILVTTAGEPVLIDFGAARQRLSERSLTVIESAGYTPFEQLQSRGKIGPWSDIYALGGTLYRTITGETPGKAADRAFDDPTVPLARRSELLVRYSARLLETIDKAMAPKASDRFQDTAQWLDGVRTIAAIRPPTYEPLITPSPLPALRQQSTLVRTSNANSLHAAHQRILAEATAAIARNNAEVVLSLFKKLEDKRFADLDYAQLKNYVLKRKERRGLSILGVLLGLLLLIGWGLMKELVFKNEHIAAANAERMAKEKAVLEEEQKQKAVLEEEQKQKDTALVAALSAAGKTAPFSNTLGMKFVPAGTPGVLFSVWETQVKDFTTFVEASSYDAISDSIFGSPAYTLEKTGYGKGAEWAQKGGSWQNPRFPSKQTGEHPVVCVSYFDAQAFCSWLTKKDRDAGKIPAAASYRLPSDAEWSRACGSGKYPWGDGYPPKSSDGNYNGQEALPGVYEGFSNPLAKEGFSDSAARTAPVGMFNENRFGLSDLGGNVQEWCRTWYEASMNDADVLEAFPMFKDDKGGQTYRVLRGASWDVDERVGLRSSCRLSGDPRDRVDDVGFRVVLVVAGG
jgi:formylglycine-generating enzyme required for sulfatase activity